MAKQVTDNLQLITLDDVDTDSWFADYVINLIKLNNADKQRQVDLAAEVTRAEAAEQGLASGTTGAVGAETTRAETAEQALATALANELAARAAGDTAEATARANAIAALFVGGKIDPNLLPAISLDRPPFVVASQTAMLALAAQVGDIAKRTDLDGGTSLMLGGTGDPTQLANWVRLSGDYALTSDLAAEVTRAQAAEAGKQPLDTDLTTIAALDSTSSGVMASDGSGWLRKTYSQLKTALGITTSDVSGLGSAATHAATDFDAAGMAALAAQRSANLSDLANPSTAVANLGLAGLPVLLTAPGAGVDAYDLIQNAINANPGRPLVAGAGVFDLLKAPTSNTQQSVNSLKIAPGTSGFDFAGMGLGTVLRCSRTVARAFDLYSATPGQTFRRIRIRNLAVDANNIDGNAILPATPVTTTISVPQNTWTTVAVAGGVNFNGQQIIDVQFPTTNAGNSAGLSGFARPVAGSTTTMQVYNPSVASMTFNAGDIVRGFIVGHAVLGTKSSSGGLTCGNNASIDDVIVEYVTTYNVPTTPVGSLTAQSPSLRFSTALQVANVSASSAPSITNIRIANVDTRGGDAGYYVAGGAGCWIDEVLIENWRHDTGVIPNMHWSSLNVLVGQSAWVGRCIVRNGWGSGSGDVGVEVDNFIEAEVSDVEINECYNAAFYSSNFASPALTPAGPLTTTVSNGGSGLSSGSTSCGVVTLGGSIPARGYCMIDSELMQYKIASTTFLTIYRGIGGTATAAHAEGAMVTFHEALRQKVNWTRCVGKRLSAGSGGMFGQSANFGLPLPPTTVRDCRWERNGADFGYLGEVWHQVGLNPRLDFQGLRININGINHTALDSQFHSLFEFPNTGLTYRTTGGLDLEPNVLRMRDIEAQINGLLATGSNAGYFSMMGFTAGWWHLDIEGVKLYHALRSSRSTSSKMVEFRSGSANGGIRGRLALRYENIADGDLSPQVILADSSVNVDYLRLELDLAYMTFAASTNNTNYNPYTFSAAQAAAVFVDRVVHPAAVANGYAHKPVHRTLTAGNLQLKHTDEYVGVTSTAAARTMTLPTASGGYATTLPTPGAGSPITIKDESGGAGTNNITIATLNSELIDGVSTKVISTNYGSIKLLSTGTGWAVL